MDELEFHKLRESLTENKCSFEKAIFTTLHACHCSQKVNIGERATITCTDATACKLCAAFRAESLEKSRFVLKLTSTSRSLPHALEIRLQCGSLNGLAKLLKDGQCEPENSIACMVQSACEKFNDFADIPYDIIVSSIAEWKSRRRSRSK